MADWKPGDIVRRGIFTVKITHAGPILMLDDIEVRSWFGTKHDQEAVDLATRMRNKIASAATAD